MGSRKSIGVVRWYYEYVIICEDKLLKVLRIKWQDVKMSVPPILGPLQGEKAKMYPTITYYPYES